MDRSHADSGLSPSFLITVITATFNNRHTIQQCLDSIFSQQNVTVELIVIDGASTDGTLKILESHADRISFLASEPDAGIYDALNKGISKSSGSVVGFLHADDIFASPHALLAIRNGFNQPETKAVYGNLQYVHKNDTGMVIRNWQSGSFSRFKLRWGWMPPHPTLYLRKYIYDRVGLFDTRYRISADYDHILRVFSQPDLNAVHIPEYLVKMRTGGMSNRSFANILRKSREDLRTLRVHQVGGLGALAWKNLSKLRQFFG